MLSKFDKTNSNIYLYYYKYEVLMITFSQQTDALKISFDGVGKLVFKTGDEVFAVGTGKTFYAMDRGTFRIKEKIFGKKALKIAGFSQGDEGIDIILDEGKVKVVEKDGILLFTPQGLDNYNRFYYIIPSDKEEGFYGSGEVFTEFNLKGKRANVWVAEHISLKQTSRKIIRNALGLRNRKKSGKFEDYETYYAQPTFISSHKYFFHSLTTARCVFDFRHHDKTVISIDEVAPFCIGYATDYESLMTSLTSLVGRQPVLPDWVYDGEILGIQGGTDVMMEKYQKAVDHDAKVTGVWIQDWEGRRVTAVGKQLFWNWEWDKDLYPDLDKKIKELNEKGCKVLGYCNPFLAIEKPLYKEAAEKGYCVKDADGKDYLVKITTFPAAMVDLTNPDAYNWLKNVIKENMIKFGLSGWMADFGEYLPTDCVLFSGEDAEFVHNTWPARWAKLNREALEETGNLGKIVFFTRAGYSDTPKYSTLMWNGDNHPDFSMDFGLPSIIPAMLSLTLCGFGLSHSDIGGYTSIYNMRRDMETYKRWFEMNAFTVMMRGHEGLNPDINVQFDADDDILDFSAKFSRIHAALKPYLTDAVQKNAEEGVEAYNNGHEYLLGRDILVAPVLRPKASKRQVYLPDDNWIHIWSQKEYKGGVYEVDAPLGEIPVFVRKDAKSDVLNRLLKEIK